MSEWWTYSLSDFLLFSPRTYYRLFELYNLALWPFHILALALGAAILGLSRTGRLSHRRIAAAILAGLWLWVGWAYFLERYQTINWAAGYVAVAFCIEALLLLWRGGLYGLSTSLRSHSGPAGLFIFMFALCAYPLVAPLLGRPWTQAEVFGLAPDPTAMATLGILMASSVWRWELLVIPGLWCLASAVTLWAMGSPDAVLPAIAAAAALLSAIATRVPVSRGV